MIAIALVRRAAALMRDAGANAALVVLFALGTLLRWAWRWA